MKGRALVVVSAVVAVVLAAAWFLLLYKPAMDEVAKVNADTDLARQEQVTLNGKLQELHALKETEPAVDTGLARAKAAVPEQPEISEFIRQANAAAALTGVDWLLFTPSEPEPSTASPSLSAINVQIQVQGKFFNLVEYLRALLALPRMFTVDSLQVAPGAGGEEGATTESTGVSPLLTATITGRIFTTQGGTPAGAPPPQGGAAATPPTTAAPNAQA